MNKAELTSYIADNAGISKLAASRVLNSTIKAVTNTLQNGEAVTVSGFGTFSKVDRSARKVCNPKTGEALQIKASKGAKFSPSQQLKDAVN